MLSRLWSMLRARRAAMLEAEALVLEHGARGSAIALARAFDPVADAECRAHHRWVARIAARRYELLRSLDTATKYDVANEWRRRRGGPCR